MYCVSEHKWKDPCTQLEAVLIPISVWSFAVRWRALYPFKAIPFTSSINGKAIDWILSHISKKMNQLMSFLVNSWSSCVITRRFDGFNTLHVPFHMYLKTEKRKFGDYIVGLIEKLSNFESWSYGLFSSTILC